MLRSFSLIELSITMILLVIASYFITPILFIVQDNLVLKLETNRIKDFIYYIQAKARLNKESYSISLSYKMDRYCIVAVKKISDKEILCDCFNITHCNKNNFYYISEIKNIRFNKNKTFPNILLNINGKTGNSQSQCLTISINTQKNILKFGEYGVIDVLSPKSRSNCNIENG